MADIDDRQDMGELATISVSTPGLERLSEPCILSNKPDPCVIVIFGASGDLTGRKLIPALYHLFLRGGLPDPCLILGASRSEMTDQAFRERMRTALSAVEDVDHEDWQGFEKFLYYSKVQYDDAALFVRLKNRLQELDRQHGTRNNRIFYLAIPPSLYKKTAHMLGEVGLSAEGSRKTEWSRIVVEKPFGSDLDSARELDQALHEHFSEHQIFRIDHYLAKETVQSILMFRFANSIFEPLWNRRYVEYVAITAAESLGVGHRAGYYEQAGVLRDMFQNHMMQLLSLTAMDPPSLFEANRVRDEKVRVYRTLRPFPVQNLRDYLMLGQYGPGKSDGEKVAGYRDEAGMNPDSLTPTYAKMKVFLDNWRWQGVPFYLTSGKRLPKKLTEIAIQFKEIPHSMFRQVLGESIVANRIILGIYPEEKITLTFQTKNPGARVCLRSVTMDFHYHQGYDGPKLDAYEKVLIDCMLGDQMLFWRQDGVELCWSFLTPILRECETCGDRAQMLVFYEAGTWGPQEAINMPGQP